MIDKNTPKIVDDDTEVVELEKPKTADEPDISRLERLLQDVEQGWKVSIYRAAPSWCRGYLETIEIYDPSDKLDLPGILKKWGGQKLHVKIHDERGKWLGGGSISCFTFPPRRFGKEITEEDLDSLPTTAYQHQPYLGIVPHQQSSPNMDITKLLEMVQRGKQDEVNRYLALLERQHQVIPSSPTDPQSMMGMMMGMMEMFGRMRKLFGDSSAASPQESGDPDSIMPMLTELFRGIMSGRQQQPAPVQQSIVPPRRHPSIYRPSVDAIPPIPSVQKPVESQNDDDNLGKISDKLSSLDPDDCADVVVQAIGNMPRNKREKAMQAFFTQLSGESELDDLTTSFDNYDQDDNDPTTDTPSQIIPPPGPRR